MHVTPQSSSLNPTPESLLSDPLASISPSATTQHFSLSEDHFIGSSLSAEAFVHDHADRLRQKIFSIGYKTKKRLDQTNQRIHRNNEKIRAKMAALMTRIYALVDNQSLPEDKKQTKIAALQAKINGLRQELKPPVDFFAMTRALESIINNLNLSKKEKKEAVEKLRREAGLSQKEMRTLFTGRLEKIYRAAQKELEIYHKSVTESLQERLENVVREYGVESPAAVELRAQLREIEAVTLPYLQQLEDNRVFYKGLYGGKSCIKRSLGGIGSFLRKAASVVNQAMRWSPLSLLSKVPGLKNFMTPIIDMGNRLFDTVLRPFKLASDIMTRVRDFIKNPGQVLDWLGPKLLDILKEKWPWLLQLTRFIPGISQAIAPIASKIGQIATIGQNAIKSGSRIVEVIKSWLARPSKAAKEAVYKKTPAS